MRPWSMGQISAARDWLFNYGSSLYPPGIRGSEGFRLSHSDVEAMLQTYLTNGTEWHDFLSHMKTLEQQRIAWVASLRK